MSAHIQQADSPLNLDFKNKFMEMHLLGGLTVLGGEGGGR